VAGERVVNSARPGRKESFSRWDAADQPKTRAQIAAYLDACMEEGGDDPAFIAAALGNITREHGTAQLARATGLTR
jgi:probable addiction module antidote protein